MDLIDTNALLADATRKNGEPVTNGDVMQMLFPNTEIQEIRGSFDRDKLLGYRTWLGGRSQDYLLEWWDAPYEEGRK